MTWAVKAVLAKVFCPHSVYSQYIILLTPRKQAMTILLVDALSHTILANASSLIHTLARFS